MEKVLSTTVSSINDILKEEQVIRTTFDSTKLVIGNCVMYRGKTEKGLVTEDCTIVEVTPDTLVLKSMDGYNNIHVIAPRDLNTGNLELELINNLTMDTTKCTCFDVTALAKED